MDLSLHDPLTEVFNRQALTLQLLKLEQDQLELRVPCFSVLMMDLDKFKEINDRCGRDAGDRVLKTFAETTRE